MELLYSSPSIIRMIHVMEDEVGRHVGRMGEKRNPYRILVGKPERDHWEEEGGWTISKWNGMVWYGLDWYGSG
jgi:hypothetical protein